MQDHVLGQISSYLDKALPAPELARVEAHLASCDACRAEAEQTRRASSMVASLPRRPLPAGFMERLARRKAAGESPRNTLAWLPGPARLAAFAAAGLAMIVVIRFQTQGDANRLMLESAKVSLKDVAEPPSPAAPAAEAAPAKAKLDASSEGDRSGASGFDNDSQQQFLQSERKRMGIREIVPVQAPAASALGRAEEPSDRPLSKKEAMSVIRQMTDNIARANQYKQMKANPVVALGSGSAPRLLSEQEKSKPLQPEAAAPHRGSNADGSVSMVASGSGGPFDTSSPVAAMTGKAQAVPSPATRRSLAQLRADAKKMRSKTPAFASSWSGASPGIQGPASSSIDTAADWAGLWGRLEPGSPVPMADFERSTALAVFGARGQSQARILSAAVSNGRMLVRYRLSPGSGGVRTPYHVVLIPRTDLPVSFEIQP